MKGDPILFDSKASFEDGLDLPGRENREGCKETNHQMMCSIESMRNEGKSSALHSTLDLRAHFGKVRFEAAR